MSAARGAAALCWVCGGATVPYFASAALEAVACGRCGHILASHQPLPRAADDDYHLARARPEQVAALAARRRRQAARVLDALDALARPPRSLFDFGCGRAFLLQVAREREGSGTYPPHYHFTRRSLESLVRTVGLEPLVVLDDPDFEPGQLGRRLRSGGARRPPAGPHPRASSRRRRARDGAHGQPHRDRRADRLPEPGRGAGSGRSVL